MFCVIYSFHVKSTRQTEFIDSWTELTKLIYKYVGSYGSRLHKVSDELYIGYAQWPDKNIWDKSGNNLPEEANLYRENLRASCSHINTEYEMDTITDLLKSTIYNEK